MELTALIQTLRNCAEATSCPSDCPMKSKNWNRMGYAACKPFKDNATYVPVSLLQEAVAQLEQHIPHILSVEELRGYDGPLWVEWNAPYDYDSQWALRDFPSDWTPNKNSGLYTKYRYWSTRPTKEQAALIPWRKLTDE